MKIGFVISMYDESETVLDSIKNIRSHFSNEANVVVVHSDNEEDSGVLKQIKQRSNNYIKLENIFYKHDKYTIAAAAICRNFSHGFSKLRETSEELDVIVGLTGDTRIFDCTLLEKHFDFIKTNPYLIKGGVLRALGQDFHASTADPENKIEGGRPQTYENNDFMPQFFMFNGELLIKHSLFCDIKITNKYTSEQCLGDEAQDKLKDKEFKDCVSILNSPHSYAYGFADGVQLQVMGIGHTRKE